MSVNNDHPLDKHAYSDTTGWVDSHSEHNEDDY